MINLISGFGTLFETSLFFHQLRLLSVFSLDMDGPVSLHHIAVVNLLACCVCVQGILLLRMKDNHLEYSPDWDYFCHAFFQDHLRL